MELQKILVIDDDPDIRRIAQLSLRKVGVVVAASGAEGIEAAAREQPSVILLDMMMPGMDGKETRRLLAAQPATAGIPVIFLTARGTDPNELMALGAVGVISKPFDVMSLPTQIRTILEGRQPG